MKEQVSAVTVTMLSERYILEDGTCPPCKDGDVTGNDPHGYEAVESGDVEKTWITCQKQHVMPAVS